MHGPGTYSDLVWVLESTANPRFPYRLTIRRGKEILLALRVRDKWPGQKGNIFCIREKENFGRDSLTEEERVGIISFQRFGKKVSIILDRSKNRRCDFLFLTRKYKSGEGEYEQIFWTTRAGMMGHKPRVKLSTYRSGNLKIIIDSGEKYPWNFSGCDVSREKLPAGDYALSGEKGLLAVVERKTFDNLKSEFANMPLFHQQLGELSAYRYSALVIEADYADFLRPERLKYYSPAFAAKAIAEIYAYHPKISVVFAGNRKLAGEWTLRFFAAINSSFLNAPPPAVSEAVAKYQTGAGKADYFGLKESVRAALPDEFTLKELKEKFPAVDTGTLRKIIYEFKRRGYLVSLSRGLYKKTVQSASSPSSSA